MKKILVSLVLFSTFLYADVQPYAPPAPPAPPPTPWFTGPLIAPTSTAVAYGHFEIEPYVYCTTNTGTYNQHWHAVSATNNFFSLNTQFLLFFGLTPTMDINIVPQFFYNTTNGQSSTHYGDMQVALDFQIFDPGATPYFPGFKFIAREIFPTGNFQRLNPKKLLTDSTGAGTFSSAFGLVFYKVYQLVGHCFLSINISGVYTMSTPVHVHGFNAYGGGYGTDGRALVGNSFQGIASFELSLTQNWVLAIDNVYSHTDATQFYGAPGVTATGAVASVGAPSSEQISFAPAIEYNFSSSIGLIAGCWFTAWGRNSTQFRSGVIEFVYSY